VLVTDKGAQTSIDGNEHYSLSYVVLRQHLGMLLTEKTPTRCNSVSKFLLFLILNEAQHVSGDTPPIIRSFKLHNVQQLHVRQPSTYAKPEAACAVLSS
jgi:hypothetical protein